MLQIGKLSPSSVRILCEKVEPEKTKPRMVGKIELPPDAELMAKDPKTLARVISFGEKVETPLEAGDIIYYVPFGGQEFTLENKTYIFLTEGEILGVFRK